MIIPEIMCEPTTYTGRDAALDIALDDGYVTNPVFLDYEIYGSSRNKSITDELSVVDSTTEDSQDTYTTNIGTSKKYELSINGVAYAKDGARNNINKLYMMYKTQSELKLWFRTTCPDTTEIFYGLVTSFNKELETDSLVTFSMDVVMANSAHGFIAFPTGTEFPTAEEIILDPSSGIIEDLGNSIQINYTVMPEGSDQSVYFVSSNDLVAEVNQNGLVTSNSLGSTTITVYSHGNNQLSAIYNIDVVERIYHPESVFIESNSTQFSQLTDTFQIVANVLPLEADQTVTYESSNEMVATVSSTGLVSPVSDGYCNITVKSTDILISSIVAIGVEII